MAYHPFLLAGTLLLAFAARALAAGALPAQAGLGPEGWMSLQQALVRFDRGDWATGFRSLSEATSGYAPERLAALEGFCASRAQTCAPLKRAQEKVRRLNDAGLSAYEAGDLAGAVREFDRVLGWLPAEPSALARRRLALPETKSPAQGLREYPPAAGFDAGSWVRLELSFSDFEQGQWSHGFRMLSEATGGFQAPRMKDLARFCASRPRTCSPWKRARAEVERLNSLGGAALRAGDADAAALHFAEAGRLAPFDPEALANLGRAASSRGEWAFARRLYSQAAQRAPEGWPRLKEALAGSRLPEAAIR